MAHKYITRVDSDSTHSWRVRINNKNYRAIFAYYFNFTTKKRTNKTFRIKKSKAYAIQQAKKWLREQDAEC